jgi:hypothetical protein
VPQQLQQAAAAGGSNYNKSNTRSSFATFRCNTCHIRSKELKHLQHASENGAGFFAVWILSQFGAGFHPPTLYTSTEGRATLHRLKEELKKKGEPKKEVNSVCEIHVSSD